MSVITKNEAVWEQPRFRRPRLPPNYFAITFGVAGLAEAWQAAVPVLGSPQAVPRALDILDAVLWLVLIVMCLAQGRRVILADLRHPVRSPFTSVSGITAMLLAAALATPSPTAARVLVIVFLAGTTVLGG
jgi:tellurite resistance protein